MVSNLIAWVCYSPRRLALSTLSTLAVLIVAGSALIGGAPIGRSPEPTSTGTIAPTSAASAQVPDPQPYVEAALGFVRQWSQLPAGQTAAQWQARLATLSTHELGRALLSTDPANLPGVGPKGEPIVRFLAQSSALIAVPLADGSSVLVTVVLDGGRALVSDIQPNAGN